MKITFGRLHALVWKCFLMRKKNWTSSLVELLTISVTACCVYYTLSITILLESNHLNVNGLTLYYVELSPPKPMFNNTFTSRIAYTPSNNLTDSIIKKLASHKMMIQPVARENETELQKWFKIQPFKALESIGIVFLKTDSVNKIFDYKIRTDYEAMTTMALCMNHPQMYEQSEYLKVQLDIDEAILNLFGYNIRGEHLVFRQLQMDDIDPILLFIYFFLFLSDSVFMVCVGKELLHETCSGLKDVMKTLGGVSSKWFWIHWLLYSIILQLPFSIVSALLLSSFTTPFLPVHLFTLWLLFVLYIINSTILLFVITCFWKNSTVGLAFCCFSWSLLHVFALVELRCEMEWSLCTLFYFVPLYNLISAFFSISSFHGTWTISAIFDRGFMESRGSIAFSFMMFILQTFFFSFVLILLDTRSRFFSCWTRKSKRNEILSKSEGVTRSTFEDPPEGIKTVIEIRGVTKRYGRSAKRTAVENVDLLVYKGETLALLGHRGAGKSTILALILGITFPSRGQILFDGKDVSRGMYIDHKKFGYCTEKNYQILGFTVMEHLVFYGLLKELSGFEAVLRATYLLSLFHIANIKDHIVSTLSVEARKKLSFAISLIGDPKVLILDEPTAGMSRESKREIWDILIQIKPHCTILITTHDMEEAEVLADRIAIFDHGKVVSCGSTMFLKNHINIGYHLTVFTKSSSHHNDIYYLIQQRAKDPKFEVISPTQVNFIIREEALERFPTLFEALERFARDLGITGISVKCKGLEDVFTKTAESFAEENLHNESSFDDTVSSIKNVKLVGRDLLHQQFETLMWNRLKRLSRTSRLILFLTICETIVLFTLIKSLYNDFHIQQSVIFEPRQISLDICGKSNNIVSFDHENENIARLATELIEDQNGKVFNLNGTDTNFELKKKLIFYSLLNLSFTGENVTVMYRSVSHMTAVSANVLTNTLLRNFTNSSTPRIKVINHPFEGSNKCKMSSDLFKIFVNSWYNNLLIGVILSTLMFPFIYYLTEARVSGFKLQQLIGGVSPLLYVLTNILFDFVLFAGSAGTYYFIVDVIDLILFAEVGHYRLLLLVVICYGSSGLLFVYLASYFIDSAIFGNFVFLTLNLFVVWFVFTLISIYEHVISITTFLTLSSLFSINPLFAAMMAISRLLEEYVDKFMCLHCGDQDSCNAIRLTVLDVPSEHNRKGIATFLSILVVDCILYFIIIIIIEYKLCNKLSFLFRNRAKKTDLQYGIRDEDVKEEIEKVKSVIKSGDTEVPLKVDELVKMRSFTRVAVNRVSFMVSEGECFGLLGPGGSGKTEVLQILTSEVSSTSGEAFIERYSLLTQRRKFLKRLGYCPQKDAFIDLFTGEEMLKMICLLRGIPRENVNHIVNKYFKVLGMTHCAKTRISEYSNGLKRKLSTALAFIGDPVVVLLDQPTSDIDPESRKRIWRLVESRRNAGQAIVLATNNTDECDTLCTRQALLEDGTIKCIGNSEYLKNKFVQGYIVLVKLKGIAGAKTDLLKEEFAYKFPNSELISARTNAMQYQIDDDGVFLSELFSELIRLRTKYEFIDYFTVSNTTLEHLVLSPGKISIQLRSRSSRLSSYQRILFKPYF